MPKSVLNRFFNCFDLKEWGELKLCLADSVYTDYSELRGTPAETMTSDQFVKLRRFALEPLKTQHLSGNHEILVKTDKATARVSVVIYRKNEKGEVFHTHCLYVFELTLKSDSWKISSIVQKVFWSDGNSKIHKGVNV